MARELEPAVENAWTTALAQFDQAADQLNLDAGTRDEYFLDLGATAFGAELDKLGVEHTVELFDGRHGGISWRYPGAIRELVLALR